MPGKTIKRPLKSSMTMMSKRQIIRSVRFGIACSSIAIIASVVRVFIKPSLVDALGAVPAVYGNTLAIVVGVFAIKYVKQRKDLDP